MKHTDDLEQRLREIPVADPPEDLAERLIADIPDELPAGGGGAPRHGWRHQWWMAAAAVFVLALSGVVTWKMGPLGPKDRGSSLIIAHDQRIPEAPPGASETLPAEQAPAETPAASTGHVPPKVPQEILSKPAAPKRRSEAPSTPQAAPRGATKGTPATRVPVRTRAKDRNAAKQPAGRPQAAVQEKRQPAHGELTFEVVDEGKQPLPGATVILSSPGMQGSRSDVTDASGKATFSRLDADEYRARVALPGYQVREYDKVPVAGAKKGRVDVTLHSAFKEEVLVTAQAPVVDVTSTTVGSAHASRATPGARSTRATGPGAGPSNPRDARASIGSPSFPEPIPTPAARLPHPKAKNRDLAYRTRVDFRGKLSSLDRQAGELEALGEVEAARKIRKQVSQLRDALKSPNGTAPSRPIPSTGGTAEPNDRPYGDVFFEPTGVNPFVDTEDDRLSTFGLDVDTGSYTVTRRYLRDGHLPPPAAVRVEEFVNAFDYGDAAPRHKDFNLVAEGAPDPFGNRERSHILRFAVTARHVDAEDRPPALLIFTVDVSGSMARENRLGLVKRALGALLGELRPDDRVGLVVYGSTGRVLLEPTRDHEAIRRAIEQLAPGGSTNAEEGLVLAYRMAGRYRDEMMEDETTTRRGRPPIVRVILCSDGVANVGRTGAGSILEEIRQAAGKGIELTTVGFGMGNYNDTLMERLADTGDGRYAYVDDFAEAHRIFVEELTGTLLTIAHEARAQVEFDPGAVERWRLLGYENRDIADERFRDPTVDAGEVGAGQTVTVLYEVKLRPRIPSHRIVATLRLRYRPTGSQEFVELERRLRARELSRSWEEASPRLQLASLVAEFAEILKHSYWTKHDSLGDVLRRLRRLRGPLARQERVEEFQDLVREAVTIQRKKPGAR